MRKLLFISIIIGVILLVATSASAFVIDNRDGTLTISEQLFIQITNDLQKLENENEAYQRLLESKNLMIDLQEEEIEVYKRRISIFEQREEIYMEKEEVWKSIEKDYKEIVRLQEQDIRKLETKLYIARNTGKIVVVAGGVVAFTNAKDSDEKWKIGAGTIALYYLLDWVVR